MLRTDVPEHFVSPKFKKKIPPKTSVFTRFPYSLENYPHPRPSVGRDFMVVRGEDAVMVQPF